jgi:ferredoxin
MDSPHPGFTVRLSPEGLSFSADSDTPLLLAAQQAGIELRSSCRNGTCRSCIARLLAGRVAYRIDWPGLSAEEKAEGLILPCVAHAQTDLLLQVRTDG